MLQLYILNFLTLLCQCCCHFQPHTTLTAMKTKLRNRLCKDHDMRLLLNLALTYLRVTYMAGTFGHTSLLDIHFLFHENFDKSATQISLKCTISSHLEPSH